MAQDIVTVCKALATVTNLAEAFDLQSISSFHQQALAHLRSVSRTTWDSEANVALFNNVLAAVNALWNKALEVQSSDSQNALHESASLKQLTVDLIWVIPGPAIPPPLKLKLAEQDYKVARAWFDLHSFEAAHQAINHALALLPSPKELASALVAAAPLAPALMPPLERTAYVLFKTFLLQTVTLLNLGQDLPAKSFLTSTMTMLTSPAIPAEILQPAVTSFLQVVVSQAAKWMQPGGKNEAGATLLRAALDLYNKLESMSGSTARVLFPAEEGNQQDQDQHMGGVAEPRPAEKEKDGNGDAEMRMEHDVDLIPTTATDDINLQADDEVLFQSSDMVGVSEGGAMPKGRGATKWVPTSTDKTLTAQVLMLLAFHHLEMFPSDPSTALHHFETAKSICSEACNTSSALSTYYWILLELQRYNEAGTELLSMITHEDASPQEMADALCKAVAAGKIPALEPLKTALPLAIQHSQEDGMVLMAVVEQFVKHYSQSYVEQDFSARCAAEDLILSTTTNPSIIQPFLTNEESTNTTRNVVRTLLYNYGIVLLREGRYERAHSFFEAAAGFDPWVCLQGSLEIYMAQALTFFQEKDFLIALDYVQEAEKVLQPPSIDLLFFKYKILLMLLATNATAPKNIEIRSKTNIDSDGNMTVDAAADGNARVSRRDEILDNIENVLKQLAGCQPADPDILRVAAMEAVDAGQKKIAHQALLLLLNMLIYEESVAAVLPPGFEATLHCNIIKLTQKLAWEGMSVGLANKTNQRGTELMLPDSEEESGQVSHAPSNTLRDRNIIPSFFNIELSSETARVVIADLSHHFNTALERFHTLGAQTFFLNDPSNTNNPSQEGSIDQHQVCWFAKEAWNAGVVAAKHGLLQSAVVLMGAAGDFSAAVPNCTDPEIVKQRQTAYLLAAAGALDVHKDSLFSSRAYTASLNLAQKYLTAAKTAAATAPMEDKLQVFLLLNEFTLAVRIGDEVAQKEVLKAAKALEGFTPQSLMAAYYKDLDNPIQAPIDPGNVPEGGLGSETTATTAGGLSAGSKQVKRQALEVVLHKLTGAANPKYEEICNVLIEMMKLASSSTDILSLLNEARGLITAAPANSYPTPALEEFVTMAWNKGVKRTYKNQYDEGKKVLEAAMGLVYEAGPEVLKGHRKTMKKGLADLED